MLPLSVPLALFAAQFILEMKLPRWLRFAIPAVLVAFHVWGNVDCALRNPPGITPQFDLKAGVDHRYDAELIAFLRSEGELRGYSNYWLAFPLAFKTGEEIIYEPAPALPPGFALHPRQFAHGGLRRSSAGE